MGDTFLLKDKYMYLGEDMQNSYYYEVGAGSGSSQDLNEAFVDTILPKIVAIQHTGCVHGSIETYNLSNPTDFHSLTLTSGNQGTVTGEGMPKWDAYKYKVARATRAVRNGAKRIGGLPEGGINNGVVSGTLLTACQSLAEFLSGDLDGGSASYTLRIPQGSFGGSFIPVPQPISGVEFIGLTTQSSRKR